MNGERVWRPGDVALMGGSVALRTNAGWAYGDGSIGGLHQDGYDTTRPAVVIDPEDDEQVERLTAIWRREYVYGRRPLIKGGPADAMQAALREFADPKPRCGAVLNLAGEHYRCDGETGHDDPHHNARAQAIWGERA